jgi:hypothetical protein
MQRTVTRYALSPEQPESVMYHSPTSGEAVGIGIEMSDATAVATLEGDYTYDGDQGREVVYPAGEQIGESLARLAEDPKLCRHLGLTLRRL